MKHLVVVAVVFSAFIGFSQEMNKWSVGAGFGSHDGMAPSRATTKVYQLHHYYVNGRYMFNNRVGVMVNLGYDLFDYTGSGKSNPRYVRTTVSGVLNAGDLIKINTISDRLGLLIHGGAGMAHMWRNRDVVPKTGNETDPLFKGVDDMLNYRFGATPQFKCNEQLSVNADLTFNFHGRQTYEFTQEVLNWHKHGINGYFINVSVGASYYFGSAPKHADWTPTVYGGASQTVDMSKYDALVKELEAQSKDDDKDGVPNFRDEEANTPENSLVNSKGVALKDTDNDGIPDAYDACTEVKGLYSNDGCPDSDGDGIGDNKDQCPTVPGMWNNKGCPEISKEVKEVMRKALKDVQFETNKDVLLPVAYPALNEVVKVLMDHPEYKLQIDGHTDNVGEDEANMILSQKRAQAAAVYLMSKGISADRLIATGYGETRPKALNDTDQGRQQNRRVEFNIVF